MYSSQIKHCSEYSVTLLSIHTLQTLIWHNQHYVINGDARQGVPLLDSSSMKLTIYKRLIPESKYICQCKRFDWPVAMMLGHVKNCQPVFYPRVGHQSLSGSSLFRWSRRVLVESLSVIAHRPDDWEWTQSELSKSSRFLGITIDEMVPPSLVVLIFFHDFEIFSALHKVQTSKFTFRHILQFRTEG